MTTALRDRCRCWPRASAISLCFAISACASQRTETRSVAASAPASTPQVERVSASEDRAATVQISKTLQTRCKIDDLPQAAPRFEYNRAALRPRERNVLDDVANCLVDGPLMGETITLIGRADARGSEPYNESLAASRAAAARDYLALRGVPVEQMRLMSRGERGARGNDEASYGLDRRVDVELGDLKNSPIFTGAMLQAETSRSRAPVQGAAASYVDTAEGGRLIETRGNGADSD